MLNRCRIGWIETKQISLTKTLVALSLAGRVTGLPSLESCAVRLDSNEPDGKALTGLATTRFRQIEVPPQVEEPAQVLVAPAGVEPAFPP